MKQVQIPQELFILLLRYHLMEEDSQVDEIRIWTGGGYRTAFVGKDFFGDIGQERGTLL